MGFLGREWGSGAVCAGSNPAGGTLHEVPEDPVISGNAGNGVFAYVQACAAESWPGSESADGPWRGSWGIVAGEPWETGRRLGSSRGRTLGAFKGARGVAWWSVQGVQGSGAVVRVTGLGVRHGVGLFGLSGRWRGCASRRRTRPVSSSGPGRLRCVAADLDLRASTARAACAGGAGRAASWA